MQKIRVVEQCEPKDDELCCPICGKPAKRLFAQPIARDPERPYVLIPEGVWFEIASPVKKMMALIMEKKPADSSTAFGIRYCGGSDCFDVLTKVEEWSFRSTEGIKTMTEKPGKVLERKFFVDRKADTGKFKILEIRDSRSARVLQGEEAKEEEGQG